MLGLSVEYLLQCYATPNSMGTCSTCSVSLIKLSNCVPSLLLLIRLWHCNLFSSSRYDESNKLETAITNRQQAIYSNLLQCQINNLIVSGTTSATSSHIIQGQINCTKFLHRILRFLEWRYVLDGHDKGLRICLLHAATPAKSRVLQHMSWIAGPIHWLKPPVHHFVAVQHNL